MSSERRFTGFEPASCRRVHPADPAGAPAVRRRLHRWRDRLIGLVLVGLQGLLGMPSVLLADPQAEALHGSDLLLVARPGLDGGEAALLELRALTRLSASPALWSPLAQQKCWKLMPSARAAIFSSYQRLSYYAPAENGSVDASSPVQLERSSLTPSGALRGDGCMVSQPGITLWAEGGPQLELLPQAGGLDANLELPMLMPLQVGQARELLIAPYLVPGLGFGIHSSRSLELGLASAYLKRIPRGLWGGRLRLSLLDRSRSASSELADSELADTELAEDGSYQRAWEATGEGLWLAQHPAQQVSSLLSAAAVLRAVQGLEGNTDTTQQQRLVLRGALERRLSSAVALGTGLSLAGGRLLELEGDTGAARDAWEGNLRAYGWVRARGGGLELRGSLGLEGSGVRSIGDGSLSVGGGAWASVALALEF